MEMESKLKFIEQTQWDVPDVLEVVGDEREVFGNTQKALMNILEDYSKERKIANETQKALINILEDYSEEKDFVEKVNIKLTSSNREMQEFAFIASHDLQEPLRTISNYIGLLQKQYNGKFDGFADQYLTTISGATFRMQSLIRDLLEYSKIGAETKKSSIDCNTLLTYLLIDMNETIVEGKAEIHFDKLPVIDGYFSAVKSLFQNLISNAVKFRSRDINSLIIIWAEGNDDEWIFSVKDNGIGIDKDYYDKVFAIFQQLHTKGEYSGTGIGLAQAKKCVEMHGGRIWVESELGKGTTFYFTIPKTRGL